MPNCTKYPFFRSLCVVDEYLCYVIMKLRKDLLYCLTGLECYCLSIDLDCLHYCYLSLILVNYFDIYDEFVVGLNEA